MCPQRANRCLAVFLVVGLLALGPAIHAAKPKPKPAPPRQGPLAPPPPRSALLKVEDWQKAPLTPIQPAEIDELVARELQNSKVQPAPLTTDEQFIRRVTLDLTGKLPEPADVMEFVADSSPSKRAKLIDRLLDSDEYAQHWARYWRDVIQAKVTDRRGMLAGAAFEKWLTDQLKANKGWDQIARAMIAADGQFRIDAPDKNGQVFFLLSHTGPDAANERAAETARIFLGIQIQCAQCHDHPTDQWKRVQFHELAGYFARMRERPIREDKRIAGFELVSLPRGEHQMPSKEDPKKGLVTLPRFLNGRTPGVNLGDRERRRALADEVVSKNNYWFAGAYVNRIWGQLMGQSFYQPVDDMGPQKEAVFPTVLTRLTGAFRGTNYDVKGLFRTVMNSETYQRQIRLGENADQHLHFAAAYPTRLRPDALWDSLVNVLGSIGGPQARPPQGPLAAIYGGRGGLEALFKAEFDFDPSLKPDDVEGSISQALLMMNNPQLNQRIVARGNNLLGRVLRAYPDNDEAVRILYLKALARKPTDRELQRCRAYIKDTGNRTEAIEDILWALINSTEFQTKR